MIRARPCLLVWAFVVNFDAVVRFHEDRKHAPRLHVIRNRGDRGSCYVRKPKPGGRYAALDKRINRSLVGPDSPSDPRLAVAASVDLCHIQHHKSRVPSG